jgi:hypothetical protein
MEWGVKENHVAFISAENWSSGSPGFNPLYCNLWAALKDMSCRKRHISLESLRRSLVKADAEIRLETKLAVTAE